MKKFILLYCFTAMVYALQAQTLYVPNGTSGISSSSNGGRVGVGTSTPGSTLSVLSESTGTTSVADFHRKVNGEVAGLSIYAYPPSVTTNSYMKSVAMLYAPGNANSRIIQIATPHPEGIIRFHTGGWGNSSTERMTINSNGNVGIGVSNPKNQLEVNGTIKAGGHFQNVLSYQATATPTHGIKIKTNIPFLHAGGMHTINLQGYNYGKGSPIGLSLTFYMYNGANSTPTFRQYKISSSGDWTPVLKLAEENGKVVIFIDERQYYVRFGVDVFSIWHGSNQDDSWFNGWTAADEALSGSHLDMVVLPYHNTFGAVTIGVGDSHSGGYKLSVAGKVRAEEVKVYTGWADFVFHDDYVLRPLADVEQFIKEKGHLPDVPSEAEVLENGIEVGAMNATLLQKIEELTLYMIEMKKENERLEVEGKKEREELLKRIKTLEDKQ